MFGWSVKGCMCVAIDMHGHNGLGNMHIGGTTIPFKLLSPHQCELAKGFLDGHPEYTAIGQLWPSSKHFQNCKDGECFYVSAKELHFRIFVPTEYVETLSVAATRDARYMLKERSKKA